MLIYVGTSTATGSSRGIYRATFDESSGAIGRPELAAETPNPTFLAVAPDRRHLYSVTEWPPLVAGFRIDPSSGALALLAPGKGIREKAPSHLSIDATGRVAVFSHYHEGYLGTVLIEKDGRVGAGGGTTYFSILTRGPNLERQKTSHVHSAVFTPDNRQLAVCDLGADKIYRYTVDIEAGALVDPLRSLRCAPGAGPRHCVFSPDGGFLYVVNELNSTVAVYGSGRGDAAIQAITTLPRNYSDSNLCAEIRLSPDSRFLYATNRGHDSIARFRRDGSTGLLEFVDTVSCGGGHPRHFSLTPDGRWLVCANRDSNNLVAFSRNPESGALAKVGSPATVPQPVCVVFL